MEIGHNLVLFMKETQFSSRSPFTVFIVHWEANEIGVNRNTNIVSKILLFFQTRLNLGQKYGENTEQVEKVQIQEEMEMGKEKG